MESQDRRKEYKEHQEMPHSYHFWAKMRRTLVIILALALVTAIVYGVVITGEIGDLKSELESVRSTLASTQLELSSTQSELTSTKQTLAVIQVDLSSTRETLLSVQNELETTETELNSTKSELSITEAQLNSAQQDLVNLQAVFSSTQQQLAVAQETLGGLGITLSTSKECSDVDLIDNSIATNPTWSQLITFISQDQTDKHTYIYGVFDCSQFSRDVHNNAEAAGIRAAEVQLSFRNEEVGHALNAFLTTDYGLVYVDCTGEDTIARIKTGKEYRAVDLYDITGANIRNDYWWDSLNSYYYLRSSTGGHCVTESIEIYW